MTAVHGAILTGGRSSRMGRPKHALELSTGETLLKRVASTLQRTCDAVVTVGSEQVTSELPHVTDERPHAGPLAGMETVLRSNAEVDWIVCPCDMPQIEPDLLQALVDSSGALVAFKIEGRDRIEHFPLLLRSEALPLLSSLLDADQRSVGQFLRQAEERKLLYVVELPESKSISFRNVNTPDDYQAILQQS